MLFLLSAHECLNNYHASCFTNSDVLVANDKSDLSLFKRGMWNSKAFFYHVWLKKKTLYRADEKCIWIFFIVEPQSEQVMAEFSGYTLLTNKVRRDFIRLEPKGHQHNYYFHVGGFMKHFANVFALLYANCALASL